jgi:hypothetical protein
MQAFLCVRMPAIENRRGTLSRPSSVALIGCLTILPGEFKHIAS